MRLYSVFDKVTAEFSAPTVHKNDAAASRAFIQGVSRLPNHDDLSLWCVAQFDAENRCPITAIEDVYEVPLDYGHKGEKITE